MQIESSLPNGFHDASVFEVCVDWPEAKATLLGAADVADSEHERAVRPRPFKLVIQGVRSFLMPPSLEGGAGSKLLRATLDGRGWCGGFEGWPPGRAPEQPSSPDSFVYSFFLHRLNDFISVEATSATFEWTAEAQAL